MHSIFAFIPEEDFGFFFSLNTGGTAAASATFPLFRAIMDHFFPSSPTGKELAEQFEACTDLSLYPGTYLANRRSESDFTKIISLGMSLNIKRTTNETLQTFNFFLQEYQEYTETEPGIFQEVDGQGKLAFLHDKDGAVESVIWANFPVITFKKPPLWELPIINAGVSVMTIVLVLWGLLLRPFGLARLFWKDKAPQPEGTVAATRLGLVVALLNVIFAISVNLAVDDDFIFTGVPPVWPFIVPWVAFIVGLMLPWQAYRCCKYSSWGRRDKIFYLAFSINMQLWFGMLWYWRIVPHFW